MYSGALCPRRRGLMPALVRTWIMWGRQKYAAYGEVGLNVGGGMYVGEDCGSAAPIQLRGTGGVRRMTSSLRPLTE